ncbi:MAG: hypothetical protein ACRC20_12470 [Segniliparus sp.]|uniref:hypothetical protein n=1 Tax=Segniliparus sp. TaxID=2804064 RepID=UPI003F36B7C6
MSDVVSGPLCTSGVQGYLHLCLPLSPVDVPPQKALEFVGGAKDSPLDLDSADHNRAKAIADGTEPVPTDPKELHDLCDKLSPQEKDAIFSRHPDIGNYDGIPASTTTTTAASIATRSADMSRKR